MTYSSRWFVPIVLMMCTLGACDTTPVTENALRDRAHRAMWQGRWVDAEALYGELVADAPQDWRIQYGYGRSAMHVGDYSEARQALEIAHTLRPKDTQIALDLAEVMYLQGAKDALFQFLHDRAEAQKTAEAYLLLAEYALMFDDPDSALEFITQAMVVDDASSVDPYLTAATLSEQIGDLDGAMRYLRIGWQIDPQHEVIDERLRAYGVVPGPTLAMPSDMQP